MNYQYRIGSVVATIALTVLFGNLIAQAPEWNYSGNYQNTMSIVLSVADECQPSADSTDIIGAFGINGEVRGVAQTNIDNQAFLTIGGITAGETIILKVYDASSDAIFTIHSYVINFFSGARLGPLLVSFDSDSQSTSGGPNQWVVDATATSMAASDIGMWSLISGMGGTIAAPSNPNTAFTGNIGTTYILAWTLSDTEGCIGETDEVSVTFAVSESEDTPGRCSDGIDNDGDGLIDCQELSCGKPTLIDITKTDPTALTCSTENLDGSIVINQTGATLYSIDNGSTSQEIGTFNGLAVGDYKVWIKNDFAGCTDTAAISLINTINAAPSVSAFSIKGPASICRGNDGVSYSADQPLNGNIEWTYSGTDATISSSGIISNVDFGSSATGGTLTAVMSNACTNNSSSMPIAIANSFLCAAFTNCIPVVNVSTALLENAKISHVFQASDTLNSNAQLINNNYEFSAGKSIQFGSEFSVAKGLSFIADIKNCTK